MLRSADGCYIDVNYEQSFVSFSLLIELNKDEYKEYHAVGTPFLDYFAHKINYWSHDFRARDANEKVRNEATPPSPIGEMPTPDKT